MIGNHSQHTSRQQKMEVSKAYSKVPFNVSMQLRHEHEVKGVTAKELKRAYPQYSPRSIYRNMVKHMQYTEGDKRKGNGGKKSKSSSCSKVVKVVSKRKRYVNIPLDASIRVRYLHQDMGIPGKDIINKYRRYSKSAVYNHIKKSIGDVVPDKRQRNKGGPKVLSQRDERRIVNEVPKLRKDTQGNFTLDDIRKASNVDEGISDSTVSRVLHRQGYALRNKRRKGILTEKDTKLRLKFAKHAKNILAEDIWCKEICFYLDGAGFTHKTNPCQNARRRNRKAWRKRNEGLSLYCTTAGSREGDGGKVAKFMVAIAYGRGVTMRQEYEATLNGKTFSEFVRQYLPPCFQDSANPDGKLFLQDGDPSQNSKLAMDALAEIGAKKFSIPPRSPDLNPIENVFHLAKRQLKKDAIAKQITHECYRDFVTRVKETLQAMDVGVIDKTIRSMNKRIKMVVEAKGQRIKY